MSVPVVSQETTYAGFWIRTLAHVIDGTLLTLIILPLNLWVYGAEYVTDSKLIAGPFDFVISWVLPAIAIILFWNYREATPGKMWLGIRVVDAETLGHPSTRQYVARYFGYIVSIVPLLLGLFWVAWDPRKQAWHDKLARTVVLRRTQ